MNLKKWISCNKNSNIMKGLAMNRKEWKSRFGITRPLGKEKRIV